VSRTATSVLPDVRHDVLSIAHVGRRLHTPAMTDSKFLSIRDAADLASVSKKTIERAYKKYLSKHSIDVESASDVVKVEQKGSRRLFFVSESFVRDTVMKTVSQSQKSANTGIDAELIRQLNIKDEQLRAKDEQLGTMNSHVSALTERLKDAQQSLQAEQTLLLQAQQKRGLVGLLTRPRQSDGPATIDADVSGNKPQWKWILSAAGVGLTASLFVLVFWSLRF